MFKRVKKLFSRAGRVSEPEGAPEPEDAPEPEGAQSLIHFDLFYCTLKVLVLLLHCTVLVQDLLVGVS